MICTKCSECQQIIPGEEVLQNIVEKVKQKREKKEKTKRKPRAVSEYNKFLSEYLKKPELKDILPKLRMSEAAKAWKISKQQS